MNDRLLTRARGGIGVPEVNNLERADRRRRNRKIRGLRTKRDVTTPVARLSSREVSAATRPHRNHSIVPAGAVAFTLGGLVSTVILTLAVLLLAATQAEARGPSKKHSCMPPHSHTYSEKNPDKYGAYSVEVENRALRVYKLGGAYYKCLFSDGRGHRLFGKDNSQLGRGFIVLERLAGPYYAFEIQKNDFGAVGSVSVMDLRTGRTVRSAPTVNRLPARCANPEENSAIATALVVKANGAVAWIGEKSCLSSEVPDFFEVHRFDSGGHIVIDSGESITAPSLTLKGSTISWTNGGSVRSARLR